MLEIRRSHRRILLRLDGILRDIRTDPSLRRRLCGNPRAALRAHGFSGFDIPDRLPKVREAAPLLTHGQLYGIARETRLPGLPLELRLLVYGLRPLALIHGREPELSSLIPWAEARGYTGLLSAYEWDRLDDEGKGGYSNLAVSRRGARAGSGAWRSLLVGVDEDTTVLAWLAQTLGMDELLGRLLGYPSCCAAAFVERWADAVASHQGDVVPACIEASGPGPHDWRANIVGRYFGVEFIQHFPCHFGCEETLAMAARTQMALCAWEPNSVGPAQAVLAAPALYTETEGIAILQGAIVHGFPEGIEMNYDARGVLVTANGGMLDQALHAASTVRQLNGHREFVVGDRSFKGALLWFDRAPASGEKGISHAVS